MLPKKRGYRFFFKNANVRKRRGGKVPPMQACTSKGGGGSRKGQFYAKVITEWPLGIWDDSKEN